MKAKILEHGIFVNGYTYGDANFPREYESRKIPLNKVIIFSANPLKNSMSIKVDRKTLEEEHIQYGRGRNYLMFCRRVMLEVFKGKIPERIYYRVSKSK